MKNAAVETRMAFTFPLEVLKAVEESGEFHIVGYAATTDFDLQGDVITEQALAESSADLLKNSTVLLNHDMKQPIGKVTKVHFDRHGLLIDALISQTEPEIIQKIKEGVLNKFSIRGQILERERKFMPDLNREVNVIQRMTLVEVSLVSVPANPEARAIGWYVSKALAEQDQPSKGGTPMPEEQVVVEEIKPEAPAAAPAPAATPEAPKPEAAKSEPSTAPAPEPEPAQKAMPAVIKGQLEPVWVLLDKIAILGGQAAQLATQAKAALLAAVGSAPAPQPQPKTVNKEELGKMIAGEVSKQVEAAIKAMPPLRKGLVEPETDAADLKKQFESLPPGKKLKAALAMHQK